MLRATLIPPCVPTQNAGMLRHSRAQEEQRKELYRLILHVYRHRGERKAIPTWRREWDSNPRYGFPYTRFPSVRLQPLGHLSCEPASFLILWSLRGDRNLEHYPAGRHSAHMG